MEFNDTKQFDLTTALRQFEVIPDERRLTVWKTLLQLPGNKESYLRLRRRRRHQVEILTDPANDKILRNVLKSLVAHSPSLQHCPYLKDFVSPFMSVCKENELALFEVLLSVFFRQCQRWFDDIPNPPHDVLTQLDIILLKQEPRLYKHLVSHGIRSLHYAWRWMQSAYSTIVGEDEWPRLWDHILCNEPSFFYCVPAAICKLHSQSLLASSTRESLLEILQSPGSYDDVTIAREAYKLNDEIPERHHPREMLRDFVRLPPGVYPTLCPTEKISLNRESPLSTEELLTQVQLNSTKVDAVLREGFILRVNSVID